nr:hypothetical protein [Tanacetum cinerariifolium]
MNVVRDTLSPADAETDVDTEKYNSGADTKILDVADEQVTPLLVQSILYGTAGSRKRRRRDQIDLANPDGHRVIPDMSKPLPLRGPPGQ